MLYRSILKNMNKNRYCIGTLVNGKNHIKIYKHKKNNISSERLNQIIIDVEKRLPKNHLNYIKNISFYSSAYRHTNDVNGEACAPVIMNRKIIIKLYLNKKNNDNQFKSILMHEIGHTIFPKYEKRFINLINYNCKMNKEFENKMNYAVNKLKYLGYKEDDFGCELFANGYTNKFFFHTNGLLDKLVSKVIG